MCCLPAFFAGPSGLPAEPSLEVTCDRLLWGMDDSALGLAGRKTAHWTGVVLGCPDFVKKRPGFSNRQEAYAALERARKRSAWLLPAGAVIVGAGCWIRHREVKIQERKTERKFNSGQANGILSMRTGFFDVSLTYTF